MEKIIEKLTGAIEAFVLTLSAVVADLKQLTPPPLSLPDRIVEDEVIAALTIWMEARGEPYEGQCAVGEVLRAREKNAELKGNVSSDDPIEVALAPFQFSCWNTDSNQRARALMLSRNDPQYQTALKAWKESATTKHSKGATHYLNPVTVIAMSGKLPSWATTATQVTAIGRHTFYRP